MLGGMVSSGYLPNAKLWAEYLSPNESALPASFKNTSRKVTSFNLVPSVLMVNNKLANAAGVKIEGYQDLLNPALKGKVVIPSPSSTSSGWEHLVNMLYAMGGGDTPQGWDYVNKLLPNLKILNGSSATHKGVADGEYIVGLVAEGMVDIYTQEGIDVSKVFMKEGVVINVDGIAVIEGSKNRGSAEKFIDFMTSKSFQSKMAALRPPRRPIRSDIDGQSTLTPTSEIKQIPMDADYIIANKTQMLEHFQDLATNY
jgi:iron(III) transport system substrate-binding protein